MVLYIALHPLAFFPLQCNCECLIAHRSGNQIRRITILEEWNSNLYRAHFYVHTDHDGFVY